MSQYPQVPLVQGPDGTLYGTTGDGSAGPCQVFKVNPDGSAYTVLKEFNGDDGVEPSGGLVLSGTTLYGTTAAGGNYGYGTVFAVNTDGTGFTVLKKFNGDDGDAPSGGLVLSGTTLYGTTVSGGSSGYGTVFAVNTDGTGFATLYSFTGGSDGANSNAGLILSGNTLYGTTVSGGNSGYGTVFAVNTDGTGFTLLKELNGYDGANPAAGLVLSGTTLYGTTVSGGNDGHGTVFSVESDGSSFTVLINFAGGDGANPYANLMLSESTLYGTTYGGGSSGNGTVFSVNTNGNSYAVLYSFTEPVYGTNADGANPQAGLVLSGTTLYGTTAYGGSSGNGTVFSVNTDGSGYTVLYSFTGSTLNGSYSTNADGANPVAGLVLSGTTLYGTTTGGGNSGNGTVFSVNTNGTGFSILYSFTAVDPTYGTNRDGAGPHAGLILSGNTLYGTTAYGGSSGNGTVFAVNTDGAGFTNLYSFTAPGPYTGINSDGANPVAGLILSGNTLYGTAQAGGSSGNGAVFAINTDGTGFTTLYSFTGSSDGANPQAGLILSGNTLYGTTANGGSFGNGTVFQINTDGSEFAVLKYFGGSDGANPNAGLVLSDATIYGVTVNGGGLNSGVLFSLSPGPPTIAAPPESQTAQAGSTVDLQVDAAGYPTPSYQWFFNGANAIAGATNSILELTNVLLSQSGAYTVVIANAYGSVTGLVATLIVQDPFINNQPSDQFVNAGDTVGFSVDAGGTSPLSFQWFKDGVSLSDGGNISGAQTPALTLSDALGADAGRYSVIVSNSYGSVTSLVAVLSVADPVIITQPVSQTVNVQQTVQFSVGVDGTQPLSFQWFKDGVSLSDGGNISGAQTSTLTLGPVLAGDVGQYSVIVSNDYGSAASVVSVLTVNPPAYSVLHYFTGTDGALPYARLLVSGTTLYGMTYCGGITNDVNSYGCGTVFKMNTDGTGFTVLYEFSGSDGEYPFSDLVLSGSTLYGTTKEGGLYGEGTVFKLNTDGTGFSVLKNFFFNGGEEPIAGLVLSDTTLYGTTSVGGTSNSGTVFKLNTDGSGFTVLKNFTGGSDGGGPWGGLVLSGTTLYGTTMGGGITNAYFPWSCGTVFKVKTDGTGFTTLYNFTGIDAESPAGNLGLSGTTLYGITESGNDNNAPNEGVVFSVNTDGSGFTVLKCYSDWSAVSGGIFVSGSTLYGTTYWGGGSRQGVVFSVNTDGSDYTMLKEFNGNDGAAPVGSLVLSGTTLYGTTCSGGITNNWSSLSVGGNGVIFALGYPPTIQTPPKTQTAEMGSAFDFGVDIAGSDLSRYQWFLNGTNFISFSANGDLELTNVQFSQSGAYTVVITNHFGAVTSAPAMLNVIAPVARRPVPVVQVMGEAGSSLNVEYTDSLGSPANWRPLDTVNLTNPPQYCFDAAMPLPPQRFYRAWQTGTPGVVPSLNLNFVSAITLSGDVGDSLELDCINRFGPTNAWMTLDTITLTNTSQLYFDVSAIGRPPRLYRIVPVP